MAAAVDQMFCTKTAPDHYVLLLHAPDDCCSGHGRSICCFEAAGSAEGGGIVMVDLQKDGYINPTNIFDAWTRDGHEGEMFHENNDHGVAYLAGA
jgi:hypothetical protein